MPCHEEQNVSMLAMGLLSAEEKKRLSGHIKSCQACARLYDAFVKTDRLMAGRAPVTVPKDLAGMIKPWSVRPAHQPAQREQRVKRVRPTARISRIPRLFPGPPALRWAFAVLIFVFGMGAGVLLMNGPLSQRNRSVLAMLRTPETLKESRTVRNYLISVEALFLNLDNMEDPEYRTGAEWKVEVEIAHAILKRTGAIRTMAQNDEELSKLVHEIEWILKAMLDRIELQLNDMPTRVAHDIREYKLIPRIHEYISFIS